MGQRIGANSEGLHYELRDSARVTRLEPNCLPHLATFDGGTSNLNGAQACCIRWNDDTPKWDLKIEQAPGEDRYIEKLEFLNNIIRLGLIVPEMASGSTPDKGTYNLGETQIDLFLANVEGLLDSIQTAINEQLMRRWVTFNFGPDAPDCHLIFEPVDIKVKHALLSALLKMIEIADPVVDQEGAQYDVDWAKLAQDSGVSLFKVDPKKAASDLRNQIMQHLAGTVGVGDSKAQFVDRTVKLENPNRGPDGRYASGGGEAPIEKHPEFNPDHVIDGQKPTGYGIVGPQYSQFKGDGHGAIAHLLKAEVGEVPGALTHDATGPIDLVYGGPKFGLGHIAAKHPEVIADLPELIAEMEVQPAKEHGQDSIVLQSAKHTAVVKQVFGLPPTKKQWLLTAFEDVDRKNASSE